MTADTFRFHPIGHVRSCYREKFGIPRQPGLVKVPARIEILPAYSRPEAFRGLQDFSHIWISFVFHQSMREHWKATVRPPRLGGNERVGVFASRSMFRPNPLGLSVVELSGVKDTETGMVLEIVGGDFLDATPVLDIKPYLPYVDALANARGGYAETAPPAHLQVSFAEPLREFFSRHGKSCPQLKHVITEVLQYDPRPAYQSVDQDSRQYSMKLYDFDVKWQLRDGRVWVSDIIEL
jgi:tRNA-Thr(GGU) m(6)t(6)A37 methyltransferase TsaA